MPAFRQTPELGEDLEDLFRAAEDLGDNPTTLLALRDLRKGVELTKPAIKFVAPYQTVCNYLVYFFNPLGTHQSSVVPGGTSERILAKLVDTQQENSLGVDRVHPPGGRPDATRTRRASRRSSRSTRSTAARRSTAAGAPTARPARRAIRTGSSRTRATRRTPRRGLRRRRQPRGGGPATHRACAGGTFKARELGIDHLKDVP